MSKPKLNNEDFCRASKKLKCSVSAIKAVADTESRGAGFYADGFPVILFERHKFKSFTNGKYNSSHPHLSGPAGNYGKAGQNQRNKFNEAFALNPTAAMKSCSFGLFQIMGFNHAVCGFATVGEFLDAMKESEGRHLDAFVNFVINNGLADEIRDRNWAKFARGYNGPAFAKNKYDTKMAAAYTRFSKEKIDCSSAKTNAPQNQPDISDKGEGSANAGPIAENVAVAQIVVSEPVIAVDQVAPVQETPPGAPPKDDPVVSIGNRVSAAWTAAGATVIAIGAWLTTTPIGIAVAIVGSIALIGIGYMLINAIRNNAAEKRMANERIEKERRSDELKAERERRAHELMLYTLKSAADPNLNAVKISAPPATEMANSDNTEAAQ